VAVNHRAHAAAMQVMFTLNGEVMQAENRSLMIHTVHDLVSYGSHILTLGAGDVLATGSPRTQEIR